jgi:hypothetical protein
MKTINQLLQDEGFYIYESEAMKTLDFDNEIDAENLKNYILDNSKIDVDVNVSDISYENKKDDENKKNGWIVFDITINHKTLSFDEINDFIQMLNKSN